MAEPTSKTESLWQDARSKGQDAGVIPLSGSLSWPIPDRTDGRTFLKFLVFKCPYDRSLGKSRLYQPYGELTVSWPEGRMVEYVDYSARADWSKEGEKEVGQYRHEAIAHYSAEELRARRAELFRLYDAVLDLFGRTELTEAEQQTVETFHRLFYELAEPAFLADYHALNPAFFVWLDAVTIIRLEL